MYVRAKSLQSCPNLCDLMDHSLPGPSVYGIFQARILEWVAMPSSRDLPKRVIKPASLTSPVLAGGIFTTELPGKLNIVYILTENCKIAHHLIASLMDQTVKNLPAMQKTAVRSLNLDDPWRKEWLSTPVFLPGDVHGQRSLGGYQSMGWQRVGHD